MIIMQQMDLVEVFKMRIHLKSLEVTKQNYSRAGRHLNHCLGNVDKIHRATNSSAFGGINYKQIKDIRRDIAVLEHHHKQLQSCLEFTIVSYRECERNLAYIAESTEKVIDKLSKFLVSDFVTTPASFISDLTYLPEVIKLMNKEGDDWEKYLNNNEAALKLLSGSVDSYASYKEGGLKEVIMRDYASGFIKSMSKFDANHLFESGKNLWKSGMDKFRGVGDSPVKHTAAWVAAIADIGFIAVDNFEEAINGHGSGTRAATEFVLESGLSIGKKIAAGTIATMAVGALMPAAAPVALGSAAVFAVTVGANIAIDNLFGGDFEENVSDFVIDGAINIGESVGNAATHAGEAIGDVGEAVGDAISGTVDKVWDMVGGFKPSLSFSLW